MTENATADNAPEVMDIAAWVRDLEDPEERIRQSTRLGDRAKDELLPDLASIRRLAAVEARQKLMDQGMTATEATRVLADRIGASPQTVMRLVQERYNYGYQDPGEQSH